MQLISAHDLETGHTYYIEGFCAGVRTNKYRGTIKNLKACTWGWDGGNVLEIGNMFEYVNGQETNSTDHTSPTFPGNVFYVHVNTNASEEQYWLFYKCTSESLMIKQVLRQTLRLDKETIWGLHKYHTCSVI
jgi:hypothetical protein